MANIAELSAQWLDAKKAETAAASKRRKVEDEIAALISVPESLESTMTAEQDGYKVKVTGRINRKIDPVLLQQIAAESGISDHLSSLFRWKPEINMAVWKATSPEITSVLSDAITSTPGRFSFAVTQENK